MTKNEYNPEEELEEQIDSEEETDESTDSEESSENDAASDDAELKAAQAEAAKYRRLFKKAQKKGTPEKDPTAGVTLEEVQELLLAKEYDEEEISEIKDLARGKSISYLQAIEHPLFKTWKDARDAEKRRADASLGTSKGAAFSKSKEVPTDRDEHREYWRKATGN